MENQHENHQIEKRFGFLSSSVDPSKLGTTVQGGILAVSSLLLFVAGLLGLPLAQSEIAEFASQAGAAISSVVILYGLVRKLVVRFAERKPSL